MRFLQTRTPRDPFAALLHAADIPRDTPEAVRALQQGVLETKRAALTTAATLVRLGRPLLIAILAVSFLHIFDSIAAIKPAQVSALTLPPSLYHLSAAALTLAIDAAALYGVAVGNAVALAGLGRRWSVGLAFFLNATFLLNAAFIVRYAASVPVDVRAAVLPVLETSFAVLLPAVIPVGIVAVERAIGRAEAARLTLTMDVTALAAYLGAEGVNPQNAAAKVMGDGGERAEDQPDMLGGRPTTFSLADLVALVDAEGLIRRGVIRERLRCSETTIDRLLAEGTAQGRLARERPGVYRWQA